MTTPVQSLEDLEPARTAASRRGAEARPFIADDAADGQVFCQVLGSFHEEHHRRGYSEGYQKAISDVLTEALALTEEFLRSQSQQADCNSRQLLYRFNRFLEGRLLLGPRDRESMSDGLGI